MLSDSVRLENFEFSRDGVDANLHSHSEFLRLIEQHDFRALISVFLPPEFVLKQTLNYKDYLKLDFGEEGLEKKKKKLNF